MKDDPIIQHIRLVRHQISERYHHNPDEMITHYIELEQRHPERFVTIAPPDTVLDTDLQKESDRLTRPLHHVQSTHAS